jgi:Peptidase family M28
VPDRAGGEGSAEEATPRCGPLRSYVDYCTDHIRRIVAEIGPRPPGSAQELRSQEYLAELLREMDADVRLEPFTVAPKAFMGFIPISGALLLAALPLHWWMPPAALACGIAALGILVGELVLYRQVVDPLFPRTTSHNLVATFRPRGEVKRILLMGGHCDSAFEWRYHYLGRAIFLAVVGCTLVGALSLLGVAAVNAVVNGMSGPGSGTLLDRAGWALVAFSPAFLLIMGFSDFRRSSPGANDNLTGVMLSIALAKYHRDNGIELEHTELRLLNTGSEEAGLRGARAYAEAHHAELSAIDSLYVALDTFRDLDRMKVFNRDRNGTVTHHPDGARRLQAAARRAGFDLPLGIVPVGATDAAAFTQAGLRAIALVAMDPTPPRWYHTRLDTPDRMSPECIEAGLRILIELVRDVDAEGCREAARRFQA